MAMALFVMEIQLNSVPTGLLFTRLHWRYQKAFPTGDVLAQASETLLLVERRNDSYGSTFSRDSFVEVVTTM